MQPTKRIWKLLTSMKLGVVLLILFAGLYSSKPVQTGVIRLGEQANIQGLYDIALKGPVNFTGLVIKKDPGVPVIWLGSALLMLGLILSFYLKPQRVWFFFAGEGTDQSLSLSLWSAAGTEMAKELLQDFSQALEQGN